MKKLNSKNFFLVFSLVILLSFFIIIYTAKIAIADPPTVGDDCSQCGANERCMDGACVPKNPNTNPTNPSTPQTIYDVVSNSQGWFVCNATGTAPQFADLNTSNYIPNFGTLSQANLEPGNKWCSFTPNVGEIQEYLFVQSGSGFGGCTGDSRFTTTYNKCCVVDGTYSDIEKCNNGDASCDPWAYFQGINSDSCPVCYDNTGNPITNNGSSASIDYSNLIQKGGNYGFGVFPGNSRKECQNTVNGGYLCGANETCKAGYRVIASSDSTVCCYPGGNADACVSFEGDENLLCKDDLGGELIPNPDKNPGVNCKLIVKSKDTTDELVCCKSGLEPSYDFGASDFEKLICYQESGNSLFGECCLDDSCDNPPANSQFDNFSIFTGGTPLHTINSFDVYDLTVATPIVVDYVSNRGSSSDFPIYVRRGLNWSEFDTLNFDFAYNTQDTSPDNFSIKFTDNTFCGPFSISENTIYNFSKLPENFSYPPNKWFRISVDISGCNLNKEVENLIFSTTKFVNFYFDNFYLSKSSDIGTNNGLDTKYCSAAAKRWLGSLNPTNFKLSDFSTWGAEMYACEQQLSMSWSGERCCGSTTQRDNYGEYFADTKLGCFAGFPVENNARVSDAFGESNNRYFNNILYYNGEFYGCNTTNFTHDFGNLNESLDGIPSSKLLIPSSNVEGFYSVRGSYYCDPNGWLNLSQANNLPIIAATLKNMGEKNSPNNYSLHCGNDMVLNTNLSVHPSGGEVIVNNYCVLRTKDSVVMGVPVNYSGVNTFLNKNLKSFHPLYNEGDSYSCNTFTKFNSTNFYQPCNNVSDWLNASYNKPFGILLFSLKDGGNSDILVFVVSLFDDIKNFFKSLFGVSANPPTIGIPETIEDFSFSELYINKISTKVIKGVRDKDTIVVSYSNFTSNMTFLKDLTEKWFGNDGTVTFNKVGDVQTVGINNTPRVNKFNWNYLTSNLRVTP